MKILLNVHIKKNNDGSIYLFWLNKENQHLNKDALKVINDHFPTHSIEQFKTPLNDEYEHNKHYSETLIYDSFLKQFKHFKDPLKLYHFQECLKMFDEFNENTIYYYKKDENLNLKYLNLQLKTQQETILYDNLFTGYDLTDIYEYLDINKIWLRISKDYEQFNILSLFNLNIDWTGNIF